MRAVLLLALAYLTAGCKPQTASLAAEDRNQPPGIASDISHNNARPVQVLPVGQWAGALSIGDRNHNVVIKDPGDVRVARWFVDNVVTIDWRAGGAAVLNGILQDDAIKLLSNRGIAVNLYDLPSKWFKEYPFEPKCHFLHFRQDAPSRQEFALQDRGGRPDVVLTQAESVNKSVIGLANAVMVVTTAFWAQAQGSAFLYPWDVGVPVARKGQAKNEMLLGAASVGAPVATADCTVEDWGQDQNAITASRVPPLSPRPLDP